MANRIKVGLVFGGKSGEHEVSVRSAASIFRALDKDKYEVSLVGINKLGGWSVIKENWLPQGTEMKQLADGKREIKVADNHIDVFFPIVHGTYGEDGCLQGMFEIMDKAYIGAGVLGSAIGMDKDVMKRLLRDAGIPTAGFQIVKNGELAKIKKYPVFVKPVNMGSSVGISKAHNLDELKHALTEAFEYDTKVIIEEAVVGREIEVSVLGNNDPIASIPGEIKPTHEFYDYEAKYIDENGAALEIPAKLSQTEIKKIQSLAIKAFKVLECSGMARVDMFLTPTGKVIINEINTLPGFTNISMYPKLWEASGISYSELLDRLIQLAIEKKKEKDRLKRSFV